MLIIEASFEILNRKLNHFNKPFDVLITKDVDLVALYIHLRTSAGT